MVGIQIKPPVRYNGGYIAAFTGGASRLISVMYKMVLRLGGKVTIYGPGEIDLTCWVHSGLYCFPVDASP